MQRKSLNREWRFHLGQYEEVGWGDPDDSNWRVVDLPHDWSIELPRDPNNISGVAGGFFSMGFGWYRKHLPPGQNWQGKRVMIEFEGVYMNAHVWLNQHLLGRHPYGYTSFQYDLTPYLRAEEPNVLKVFVDNTHQLNSRWYSGSGIYRPVWLVVSEPVHVAPWGVYVTTPQITRHNALVRVKTKVENQTDSSQVVTVRTRIFDPDGSEVGSCQSHNLTESQILHEFSQDMQIKEPMLWSPETPHLYRLETEVLVGVQQTDTETTTFGIRTLEFSAEKGFLLNGKAVLLKGGCVHHDNGVLGAASYTRSEERKVEIHKANGYNAIRCAHNPPAPAFLDACDRLGMLVIDEAFDCWREGKNIGDYHVIFDEWWQRDLESMLYRDRNHPSIIMWSIGNEVLERDGRGGGAQISRKLADHVRAIDPTRPVTSAICGSWTGGTWEETVGVFDTLDVGGYNYQWQQYRPDHTRHPARIMMGTESFPLEAFENWMAVLKHPYVIGDFVWTSLDYLGESGIGRVHFDGDQAAFLGEYPWHQANCGDLDLCGFKRPQSFYRDILWYDDPRVYIAVHNPVPDGADATISRWGWPEVWPNWNWAGQEGQVFKVDIYANCEQVELFINGRPLGTKPCTPEGKFTASFEIPYEPGELSAIGYRNLKPAAECRLKTAGEPRQIRLVPDRETIQVSGDLCFVTVEVLDINGQVHPGADNEVTFSLDGPATILAVGNSNPVSEEPYIGKQRRVFRGRALVVIKSSHEPGEISLQAHAEGLEGAGIIIKSM